jgi:hypothetical protein
MNPRADSSQFRDAIDRGLHRASQVAWVAVASERIQVYLRGTYSELIAVHGTLENSELRAHILAGRAAARTLWSPALDPGWTGRAGLTPVLHSWGAAMPFADPSEPWHEPAAATAMRACEERLRQIHPYAMRRYDLLRDQGRTPAASMREAAPFFGRAPRPYGAVPPGRRRDQDFPRDITGTVAATRPVAPPRPAGPAPARPGTQRPARRSRK